jgi:hypothetical protein
MVMAPSTNDLQSVFGLVFKAASGSELGVIRPFGGDPATHPAASLGAAPFAEDGCGNAFVQMPDGRIQFWDHEADEMTRLADDWPAFVQGCAPPKPAELDPSQVKSVWIDPEFAKKFGLKGSAKPKEP